MRFLGMLVLGVLIALGAIAWYAVSRVDEDQNQGPGPGWEWTPPLSGAKPVATSKRLSGIYPAGSQIKDTNARGGFGRCDNYPKDLGDKTWGDKDAISLVAFPDEPIAYFKHRGIGLRLVNRTRDTAAFKALDSRLYIVQEALDGDGQWREIENLTTAICGNSFHRVFLKSDQFWEFKARAYSGALKTKLRFRLDLRGENDDARSIYSNVFDGEVSKTQLRKGPTDAEIQRALSSKDGKEEGVVATLTALLANEDGDRQAMQRSAVWHLGDLGPTANQALPALGVAMKGPDLSLRATSAYAHWKINRQIDEPVRVLAAVLREGDVEHSHGEAILWLQQMAPAAQDAVPALCQVLANGDEDVRQRAAEALGFIHSRPLIAVPALARALKDNGWYTRSSAGHSLGKFGADAKTAVPQLTAALEDRDGHARVAAAFALWLIEKKAEPSVSVLIAALKDKQHGSYAPDSAAEKLGEIGPAAQAAVPELVESLKIDNRGLRIATAGALWKITQKAGPAISVLIEELRGDHSLAESNTSYAFGILQAMGPHANKAFPMLAAKWRAEPEDGNSAWVRDELLKVLRAINPDAAKKLEAK